MRAKPIELFWQAATTSTKASTIWTALHQRRRRRGAVPQGLFSWRRHGQRQGPAGGGHYARQLAARPPRGRLDLEIRQADRGCAARLVGARPGEAPDRAAIRTSQGTPIRFAEGILFTTYATLRCSEREGKTRASSKSSTGWAPDFDGVILFDEAHAMANAAGDKSDRGDKPRRSKAAQACAFSMPCRKRASSISRRQGATTVHNLAYAQRLGLWGGTDFPFATTGPILCSRSRPAASPPWKCWRAI